MKRIIVLTAIVMIMVQWYGWAVTKNNTGQKETRLNPELFSGLELRNIGPALTSGRISDIAVNPQKRSIWYVAVGSGNVWKTVNSGTTWTPIFDNQGSYSIGCVTIDPNDSETVWVGTGENVSGRHVGFGDGIYKSVNGGKTWGNMGLKKSEHISKILVDPRDSRVIYVAAEGPLWSPGGERGLYKSADGGQTWQLSLTISKDTGVTDVAFEPGNSDIVYAAAYQRRRSVAAFLGGGPESGIYKTTDAGKNWRRLEEGLPKCHMGRIGLAVSPIKPNVVYATIEATSKEKGFYRSENRGENWEKRSDYISGGTGPHYYQEIFADPHRFDRVYQMDVWMKVTDNGGITFKKVGENYKHSDNHALVIDPNDSDHLLAGCDGGVYETWDCCKTWKFVTNLPVTQFYKLALDNAQPFYNVHGGTQDNGSQMGPSRTLSLNGIVNSDWFFTLGADGYASAIDPENPDIIYAEWQSGNLSRYDKKNGEEVSIQPRPAKGESPDRWNWDSPIIISPFSTSRIYYASQRLYRSDDRGNTWTMISPDLTRSVFRYEQPIMGKTWSVDAIWDHNAMSYYGSLTSISESPLKEGLIYVGTDDGLIQVTEDGGKNWRKVESLPGVPPNYFVNEIKTSLHDVNTVYVVIDNHKTGDFKPYLVKSVDRGKTWTSITGDLPSRNILWSIAQDHVKPNLLFIGTEFGLYFTMDSGKRWIKFSGGVPVISFRDIEIQKRENDLVGASFGRGIFVLDDYSPLREIDEASLEQEVFLFSVRKALTYIPKRPFDLPGKGFNGDSFFTAPNPPFGAIFTYYLKDSLKFHKEQRNSEEKKLEKAGKSIPFPGWDAVRKEEREEEPAVILTVKDEKGQVVRQLTGPVSQGIHRVAWDLRYPPVEPTRIKEKEDREIWDTPSQGPLVVPGNYSVSIAERVDGVLKSFGNPRVFIVESLGIASLPARDKAEVLAFQAKAEELLRAMEGSGEALSEALEQLKYIKKALMDTPNADSKLGDDARILEKRLLDIRMELSGDETLVNRSEPYTPSLFQRVNGQIYSTAAITGANKHNYEIAAADFAVLVEKLRQVIDVDLKKLEEKMDEAGAPWTPGRGVPKWKKN